MNGKILLLTRNLRRWVSRSLVNQSKDLRDHRHTQHKDTAATGHHELQFHRFWGSAWFWQMIWQLSDKIVKYLLYIRPVKACRAEQCASHFMIEATIRFNISGKRRNKCLSSRNEPFEDGRFKSLGIVASRTRRSFTHLPDGDHDDDITGLKTY